MTKMGFCQVALYLITLFLCIKPLGWYIAGVYQAKLYQTNRIEQLIYRLIGINPQMEMNWTQYLSAVLIFNFLGILFVYSIQRLQYYLPLNPEALSSVSPLLAFNTASSFVTNTNWQAYAGEVTMSYFTQMIGLTVQNFISAATGMSLLLVLIRGIIGCESTNLGNFWVDTLRGVMYILIPMSLLFATILVSQGVIQNFKPYQRADLIQPFNLNHADQSKSPVKVETIAAQVIPMGPVASQIAIKQLGSNGGGFFNTNSAHPFENPTPLSNFLEMLAIVLIPAALCYSFGLMVNDKKQGWAILAAMFLIYIPFLMLSIEVEQRGNPAIIAMGIDPKAQDNFYPAGNMEGKEARFGIVNSAIWATATTATSNGSTNAMMDSFMPLGGLVSLWMMHLGEIVFGGVGSGLYSMLIFIIITVFVAGLMVGRTPEYLGKKIEPYEMKMASFAVLVMPLTVLIATAVSCVLSVGTSSISNPGAHGFTEILYAFSSMGSNNGSAFAGLNANTAYYNFLGGLVMLVNRFWIAIPAIAIAGSLARKKRIPASSGTLTTYTPLFIVLLVSVIMLIGALSFIPSLALGPIVEHLMIWGQNGN